MNPLVGTLVGGCVKRMDKEAVPFGDHGTDRGSVFDRLGSPRQNLRAGHASNAPINADRKKGPHQGDNGNHRWHAFVSKFGMDAPLPSGGNLMASGGGCRKPTSLNK